VVDQNKIANRNNKRNNYCNDRVIQRAHFFPLLRRPGSSIN
jgi:hypothetical protein